MEQLLTVGQLAIQCGQPRHVVEYLIETLDIEAIGRAGILRVYPPAAVDTINKALAARAQRKADRAAKRKTKALAAA